jgi:hypothetical protein
MQPKELIEARNAHERILDDVERHNIDLLVLLVRKSSHLWVRERGSGAFLIIANGLSPVITITG